MPTAAVASPVSAHTAFVSCLETALIRQGYGLPPCLGELVPATVSGHFFRTQLASLEEALGCRIQLIVPEMEGGLAWNTHPEPGDLSDTQVLYLCRLKQAVLDRNSVIVRTRPLWSLITGWTDNLTMLPYSVAGTGEMGASVEKPYETDCAVVVR